MIHKNLELNYHKGTITNTESIILFTDMTQKEMWDFQDKCSSFYGSSISDRNRAKDSEDRIFFQWNRVHDIWEESFP